MAHGEPKRDDCDTPPRKKPKIKYDQKYKAEYADEFKCVTRSAFIHRVRKKTAPLNKMP